ncbi:hypothetical protein ACLMJK_009143 [Lecanora helva]
MQERTIDSKMSIDGVSEEYFDAKSHFSDTENDLIEDQEVQAHWEPSRLLPDEENQLLNAEIDRLVDVLISGREVLFDQDPSTGLVNVSAECEDDDAEASIAAFPTNFGNIITRRKDMVRKPSSPVDSWSTTESSSEGQEDTLDDLIEKYEHSSNYGPDAPVDNVIQTQRLLRELEKEAGDPRGSKLALMGLEDIEIKPIQPLPLDYNKLLPRGTPNVSSHGSELDCSSPLFMESYRRRAANSERTLFYSSPDGSDARIMNQDRVLAWLGRIEGPSRANTPDNRDTKARNLDVFRDSSDTRPADVPIGRPEVSSKILKDVSNLRHPGYLAHNSFAIEKKQKADDTLLQNRRIAAVDSKRDLKRDSQDSYSDNAKFDSHQPRLLISQSLDSPSRPKELFETETETRSFPEQIIPQEQDLNVGKDLALEREPLNADPGRAASFEHALARLEGRAAPEPSSPIRRWVNPHSAYGSDVQLSIRRLRPREPIAVRYRTRGPTLAQQFERMLREEQNK